LGQVLELKEDQMHKLILLAAGAAMALPGSTPGQANPPGRDPAPVVLAFCQEQVALDPTLSLGTCMSFFLSGDEGFLTQFCHYLQDHGQLDGLTFEQCVREIRR
jgi:hypothetical protein